MTGNELAEVHHSSLLVQSGCLAGSFLHLLPGSSFRVEPCYTVAKISDEFVSHVMQGIAGFVRYDQQEPVLATLLMHSIELQVCTWLDTCCTCRHSNHWAIVAMTATTWLPYMALPECTQHIEKHVTWASRDCVQGTDLAKKLRSECDSIATTHNALHEKGLEDALSSSRVTSRAHLLQPLVGYLTAAACVVLVTAKCSDMQYVQCAMPSHTLLLPTLHKLAHAFWHSRRCWALLQVRTGRMSRRSSTRSMMRSKTLLLT